VPNDLKTYNQLKGIGILRIFLDRKIDLIYKKLAPLYESIKNEGTKFSLTSL
jgi:hypothetical protein